MPVIELWERPEDPLQHTIGFSNREAAAKMTGALIDRGYKNIAFLGEADDAWTRGAARRAGWRDAMQQAGLSDHRLMQIGKPPLSIEDGAAAAPQLLAAYPDIDCIFCVSDVPAFGVLSALKAEGKNAPNDLGIVGFGNFEVSRFSTPAITTVQVDPYSIGRATGQLLSEVLGQEGPVTAQHVPVEIELSFRGSTR